MNSPCEDCKNREERCHSRCEAYKQFKKEHEKIKEKERREYENSVRLDAEIGGRRRCWKLGKRRSDLGYVRKR